uniref:Uncharacterized protein n=1 Tax=Arundo donax TaxID=35708 RepID=A0A0A9A0C0_ARUDO
MRVQLIWRTWMICCRSLLSRTKLQILDRHRFKFFGRNTQGEGLLFQLRIHYILPHNR